MQNVNLETSLLDDSRIKNESEQNQQQQELMSHYDENNQQEEQFADDNETTKEVKGAKYWAIQFLHLLSIGPGSPPLMVPGDVEGFLFIFFNNFLNLSITYSLLTGVVQYSPEFVTRKVLPGMGVSVFVGSVFYWWQARRLSIAEKRDDVCALPFGISTPSLFAFVFFILLPEKAAGGDAFAAVIFATFWSGIIEGATAFYGFAVRKFFPNIALISSLTGIAIALIAAGTLYEVFEKPMLSMIPLLLFVFATASRVEIKMPKIKKIRWLPQLFLPWGIIVVIVGLILGWILKGAKSKEISFPTDKIHFGFHYPYPSFTALGKGFANGAKFAAILIPLAVINGIGSLQNLVFAKSKGDDFDTTSTLIVNGGSSMVASFFGCVFPTTIFIGHPTLKAMGARSAYMLLNGVGILIVTTFGLVQVVLRFMPIAAFIPILVFIGFAITMEGFSSDDDKGPEKSEAPRRHHLAAAVGIMPALSALTVQAVTSALSVTGTSWTDVFDKFGATGFYLGGAISMSQGSLLSSTLLAAVVVHWIDREYIRAAINLVILSLCSWIGIIHAYTITPTGPANLFIGQNGTAIAAPGFALSYALFALFMFFCHWLQTAGIWKQGKLELFDGYYQWVYPTAEESEEREEETERLNQSESIQDTSAYYVNLKV